MFSLVIQCAKGREFFAFALLPFEDVLCLFPRQCLSAMCSGPAKLYVQRSYFSFSVLFLEYHASNNAWYGRPAQHDDGVLLYRQFHHDDEHYG